MVSVAWVGVSVVQGKVMTWKKINAKVYFEGKSQLINYIIDQFFAGIYSPKNKQKRILV